MESLLWDHCASFPCSLNLKQYMNIFILDEDSKQAAIWHCDQHIQSAVKEYSQMLACMFTEEQLKLAPLTQNGTIRKHSYYNHPCTKWLRESKENYDWGFSQLQRILVEFACRFGSIPNSRFFNWVNKNISMVEFPTIGRTEFATAFTEGSVARWCLDSGRETNPIDLYRIYYKHDKPFATWKQNKPDWL